MKYRAHTVEYKMVVITSYAISAPRSYRKSTSRGTTTLCRRFLALTDSLTERQVCSYTDYFNGTYTIWCPAPPTMCAVLTIRRQCVRFMSSTRKPVHALDQLVLRRSVCPCSTTTRAGQSKSAILLNIVVQAT